MFFSNKTNIKSKGRNSQTVNTPEVGSALVKVAHKLSSKSTGQQVVKLGDKYYRVKELG